MNDHFIVAYVFLSININQLFLVVSLPPTVLIASLAGLSTNGRAKKSWLPWPHELFLGMESPLKKSLAKCRAARSQLPQVPYFLRTQTREQVENWKAGMGRLSHTATQVSVLKFGISPYWDSVTLIITYQQYVFIVIGFGSSLCRLSWFWGVVHNYAEIRWNLCSENGGCQSQVQECNKCFSFHPDWSLKLAPRETQHF